MKNIRERVKNIYDHYGEETQTEKFFEEIEELKEVIGNKDIKNISQEMADVFIMSLQMLERFNINIEEVIKQINYKVARQEYRIEIEQLKEYNLKIKNKDRLNKYLDELIKKEGL